MTWDGNNDSSLTARGVRAIEGIYHELQRHSGHAALSLQIGNLMSTIAEFAARQTAFNTRMDAGINGLAGDIAALAALIAQLQSAQGTLTPEQQAVLDGLSAQSETLAARIEALDGITPPAPPVG